MAETPNVDALMAQISPVRGREGIIRQDERQHLAALLEDHADTLSGFVSTPEKMLELIIFLLRLKDDESGHIDGSGGG